MTTLCAVSISEARKTLMDQVGAYGRDLIIAVLADIVRQVVVGSTRSGSGVSRRRTLFHLATFRTATSAILDDTETPANTVLLDRLVQIGDIIQNGDLLYPVPLRVIETPSSDVLILLGTVSSTMIVKRGLEVRAAGVGRMISKFTATSLGLIHDSLDSWLALPPSADCTEWMAAFEAEVQLRAEYMTLEPEGIEVLTKPNRSNRCSWEPLSRPSRDGSSAVASQHGTSLVRVMNGRRVLNYFAVLGDPIALLKGRSRVTRLSLNDGKRLHLALCAEQGTRRVGRWGTPSPSTSWLQPLRVAWSDVPYPEATVRSLGTSFPISDGTSITAFNSDLAPMIDHLLGRLGFRVEKTNAG